MSRALTLFNEVSGLDMMRLYVLPGTLVLTSDASVALKQGKIHANPIHNLIRQAL
jgi:hypothetical protein